MENRNITSAIISKDGDFCNAVRSALLSADCGITLGPEINAPFREIGSEQLKSIKEARSALVFLDLEEDPVIGIRLAQFLAESDPSRRIVAAGPVLSPDLLMDAMRAGVTEYLAKPVAPEALQSALDRVQRKLGISLNGNGNGASKESGEVLAVLGAKGGSGATTVATNLAIQLHRLTGKKTLLVDLELEHGEVAAFMGMQPRFSFMDLVRNYHRLDAELLASYIERHESGVHLLAAPVAAERADPVPVEMTRRILRMLKQHYGIVVVDASRSLSLATQSALEEASRILVVASVDLPSLRNIKRCMTQLDRIQTQAKDRVRLVVNRHHPNNPITLEEVTRTLGINVSWTLANDYGAVMQSINAGIPLAANASNKSRFATDLAAVANDLAGIEVTTSGRGPRFLSFTRIFGRKGAAAHE